MTGLNAALIEKDYYCSLLLSYVYRFEKTPLVFRGGTCLSKIHADFYRLSEDLDFTISTNPNISRSIRSKSVKPFKEELKQLTKEFPGLELVNELKGHYESRQYIASISYASTITDQPAIIKIDIGLREPLLLHPTLGRVRTLLINPLTKSPPVSEFQVACMAIEEAYAEKIRAALTRRPPAIRDFYDVYYAVQNLGIKLNNRQFLELVMNKLSVPGNDPIDLSPSRREILHEQIDTQLNAVLRRQDFERFDLDQAFDLIANIGANLQAENLKDTLNKR